jgi:hypothetical protein
MSEIRQQEQHTHTHTHTQGKREREREPALRSVEHHQRKPQQQHL